MGEWLCKLAILSSVNIASRQHRGCNAGCQQPTTRATTEMKTTGDYLKEAKNALKIGSDRQLALRLGVTASAMSRWLHGGRPVDDDDVIWQVAEILDIEPSEIMAARAIERAERSGDDDQALVWKKRWQAVSHAGVTLFVIAIAVTYQAGATYHSILCQIAKRCRHRNHGPVLSQPAGKAWTISAV